MFDVWQGDTQYLADANESNTTVTMPTANVHVTATYVDDPDYVWSGRGYLSRPSGFDMDRDGTLGEPEDSHVGDGVTTDPDGDGTDEDIIYVDAYTGNDTTGDGSAGNPYLTVKKALDMCDGPGDGAEDIVAIYGTFYESVSIKQDGISGYYTRDNFQFPDNPSMLIGWDKDNDGEYPPFDTDDEAVLDGNLGATNRAMGIRAYQQRTNMEIAHLTITNYGGEEYTQCGAILLFNSGPKYAKHCYVHDVEIKDVNKEILDGSSRIVINWWGGVRQYAAIVNVLVDGYSAYCFRGSPSYPSSYFRFQNLTLKMYGISSSGLNRHTLGWKLWGTHNNVEVIDNIIDAQPDLWQPEHIRNMGLHICYCAQGYTIRNNEFIDCRTAVVLDGDTGGYCGERPVTDIIIDRNIIINDYPWSDMACGIAMSGGQYGGVEPYATVEDVDITNNFILMTDGSEAGIYSEIGNDAAPNAGEVTIVGNTISGPWVRLGDDWGGITILGLPYNYKQDNFTIKNNIFYDSGAGYRNIALRYAPANLVMNGNVYDPGSGFHFNGSDLNTLADWQAATGQDANAISGVPLFVDVSTNDFHLHPNDIMAISAGVDISDIIDYDIDGDTRNENTHTAGADVQDTLPDIESPTIIAWYSAAEHGRGVGEALLEIPDDNSFSEPRCEGVNKLVVEFSEPMNPINFTSDSIIITGLDANNEDVDLGAIIIGTSLRNGDIEGVITFSPALEDYAKYFVSLDGPTDALGNPLSGDTDRILTALVGDVSGDLRVNATDLSLVRANRTNLIAPAITAQVRCDVSGDGRVNATDMSRVRACRGNDATTIGEPDPPPEQYTLTVNDGSGDGDYVEGTVVSISAALLPDKFFDRWVGDVVYVADANDANTTVTMPAGPVTVTAAYTDDLPSPWQNTDIGAVGIPGSAGVVDGNWTIQVSGYDIWNDTDQFHFVYQPASGDMEIIAQITSVQNTHDWAKYGVMIRESLDGDSTNVLMASTPTLMTFQRRIMTGGNTNSTIVMETLPEWVKLTRVGDTFTGYISDDGATWTLVDSVVISMSAEVYVGLAGLAHNDTMLGTGTIQDVSVNVTGP